MREFDEQIKYWLKSAAHDLETAESLFKNKRYDWCLFVAHLVLEKTLKAFYVRDNHQLPPRIHKLELIVEKTMLQLSPQDFDFLKEVNEFNLEVRYPDFKLKFYKLCTYEFTKKYFNKIKDFYQWLLKRIK